MRRPFALYAQRSRPSGASWRRSPLAQGALRRRAFFNSRDQAFTAYKGRGAFRSWPDAILRDYLEDGLRERPSGDFELSCAPAWEASNFAAQGADPWRAIRQVKMPVRIFRAERGSTCRVGEGFAHRGVSVTLETVPGTSHFLAMERPDVVQAALAAACS